MTVKDTLDVADLPASAGLGALLQRTATDAKVVARARNEGAVIWGKTNTPVKAGDWQTYNALYGTTNNPWSLDRTPGGSSGGSAAVVAAGISALEIGADIGGSLRIPASFCGVFSHKPTYGLVSQRGLVPPVGSASDIDMAVVGPVARSVRDLRLLLSVIAEDYPLQNAEPKPLKGLRVGLWLDEPTFVLDPLVRQAIEGFAAKLSNLGVDVRTAQLPFSGEDLMATYTLLLFSLLGPDLPPSQRGFYELLRGPALMALSNGAGALSWAQGVIGYTARHGEWLNANERRSAMTAKMRDFFSRYDLLISPVSPSVAFPHDHRALLKRRIALSDGRQINYLKMMDWVALASTCGLPATSMPIGFCKENLPIGVQVIGAPGADAETLAFAQRIEEELGGYVRSSLVA